MQIEPFLMKPQPVGKQKWYVNVRGYHEFNARNRPEGWNAWVTLAIPLGS